MALVKHSTAGGENVSSTIVVSKTGPLEITVSAGTLTKADGAGGLAVYILPADEVLPFTAHGTNPKDVIVGLIFKEGGSPEVQAWADEIELDATLLKDATSNHADPADGYELVERLASFQIPAGATDLFDGGNDVNWLEVL